MILHDITTKFEQDEYVTLRIIQDATGVHWEVESNVWNEVQPPDPNIETCIVDLVENMRTYAELRVTYADSLLTTANNLKLAYGIEYER